MQIFLARDNKQAGPYTLEQLNSMLASGQVQLTDLAWHNGMENWLPLEQMTGGSTYYTGTPSATATPPLHSSADTSTASTQNAWTTPSASIDAETDKLAGVGTRIGAVVIDQLLFFLCFLPIFPYINLSMADLQKAQTPEQMLAMYQNMLQAVPSTAQSFMLIAVLGLIALQLFLLAKRGQSIGKLLLGIRIVDINTRKIPSAVNVIFLRTLLFNFAYNLPLIGMVIFFADIAMLFFAGEHRTLHDRLAKTNVLVAQDAQLDK